MIRGSVQWEELFSTVALNKSRQGMLQALHSFSHPFIPEKTSLAPLYSSLHSFFLWLEGDDRGVVETYTDQTRQVMSPLWTLDAFKGGGSNDRTCETLHTVECYIFSPSWPMLAVYEKYAKLFLNQFLWMNKS